MVVNGPAAAQCAVALEAMMLEPVLAPLFAGCDAAGQVETGAFAFEIAKQLEARS